MSWRQQRNHELLQSRSKIGSFGMILIAAYAYVARVRGQFLACVLLHNAPLSDPKDLAALLASYAREARHRVEQANETAAAATWVPKNTV
jgi:hypothetical protein